MIVTADMERPRLLLSRALLLSVALLLLLFCASVRANAAVRRTVNGDPAPKLVYFPIDERFATRGMFLNLAAATPFDVVSPPPELICSLKQPADTDRLAQWLEQNLPNASVAVISIEMALYGGLVRSVRLSVPSLQ